MTTERIVVLGMIRIKKEIEELQLRLDKCGGKVLGADYYVDCSLTEEGGLLMYSECGHEYGECDETVFDSLGLELTKENK
tara:strand:- start:30 stop:269 length:240 start_codon:yes stop_codon:yes gene_type:complete